MTAQELSELLRRERYPPTWLVDKDTYENAERAVLENLKERGLPPIINGGLDWMYFKGTRIILK